MKRLREFGCSGELSAFVVVFVAALWFVCREPATYSEQSRLRLSDKSIVLADKGSHATAGYTFSLHLVKDGQNLAQSNEIAVGRGYAGTMELSKKSDRSVTPLADSSTTWDQKTNPSFFDGVSVTLVFRPGPRPLK